MKKLTAAILLILFLVNVQGQILTTKDLIIKSSFNIKGKKILKVSNDNTALSKDSSSLITEAAAKLYADQVAGSGRGGNTILDTNLFQSRSKALLDSITTIGKINSNNVTLQQVKQKASLDSITTNGKIDYNTAALQIAKLKASADSSTTTGKINSNTIALQEAKLKASADSLTTNNSITASQSWVKDGADARLAGTATMQGMTLNVGGTSYVTAAYFDAYGSPYSFYTHGGYPMNFDPKDNGDINLKTSGAIRLKVQGGGDIAIEQNAIIAKALTVGTGDENSKVTISNSKSGINEILAAYNSNTSSGIHGSSLLLSGYYKSAAITAYGNPTGYLGGNLQIQTYKDATTKNTGIFMNTLGLVGVNKLNPIYQFDVNGEARFTGEVSVKNATQPTSAVTLYQLDSATSKADNLTAVYPLNIFEGVLTIAQTSKSSLVIKPATILADVFLIKRVDSTANMLSISTDEADNHRVDIKGGGNNGDGATVRLTANGFEFFNKIQSYDNIATNAEIQGGSGRFGGWTGDDAVFSANSTSQPIYIPRMTKLQRNALNNPKDGAIIYQTDEGKGLRTFNGTNWMKLAESIDN